MREPIELEESIPVVTDVHGDEDPDGDEVEEEVETSDDETEAPHARFVVRPFRQEIQARPNPIETIVDAEAAPCFDFILDTSQDEEGREIVAYETSEGLFVATRDDDGWNATRVVTTGGGTSCHFRPQLATLGVHHYLAYESGNTLHILQSRDWRTWVSRDDPAIAFRGGEEKSLLALDGYLHVAYRSVDRFLGYSCFGMNLARMGGPTILDRSIGSLARLFVSHSSRLPFVLMDRGVGGVHMAQLNLKCRGQQSPWALVGGVPDDDIGGGVGMVPSSPFLNIVYSDGASVWLSRIGQSGVASSPPEVVTDDGSRPGLSMTSGGEKRVFFYRDQGLFMAKKRENGSWLVLDVDAPDDGDIGSSTIVHTLGDEFYLVYYDATHHAIKYFH